VIFSKKFVERKKDFYLCSGKLESGLLDDHAELVKTNKLKLQVAENEKCMNFEYF